MALLLTEPSHMIGGQKSPLRTTNPSEDLNALHCVPLKLQRMHHAGELVSPSRGLYTTPGHPCLAQHTLDTNTIPPNTPVPTVPNVPNLPTKVTAHLAETLLQVRCLPP